MKELYTLGDKSITELKQLALGELNLTLGQIRKFGDRRFKKTWTKAIQSAIDTGKTTQDCRNLPEEKTTKLSTVPYLEDSELLAKIKQDITEAYNKDHLVEPAELSILQQREPTFCKYKDWMQPGNFIDVELEGLCQILYIDCSRWVYFMNIENGEIHRYNITCIANHAKPVNVDYKSPIDYIKHLNSYHFNNRLHPPRLTRREDELAFKTDSETDQTDNETYETAARSPVWVENDQFCQQLRAFFHFKIERQLLVLLESLMWKKVNDKRFKEWTQDLAPGSLRLAHDGPIFQILMFDQQANCHCVHFREPKIFLAPIRSVLLLSSPFLPEDKSALLTANQYIESMYNLAKEYYKGTKSLKSLL